MTKSEMERLRKALTMARAAMDEALAMLSAAAGDPAPSPSGSRRGRKIDPSRRSRGTLAAITAAGGVGELAGMLGVSSPAVTKWRHIPERRIYRVSELTGVPVWRLRA